MWLLALVVNWFAPETASWVAVRIALTLLSIALLVAFVAVWLQDRRRGDSTVHFDDRLVLTLGALMALGSAVAAEKAFGSTDVATAVFVGLVLSGAVTYYLISRRLKTGSERDEAATKA